MRSELGFGSFLVYSPRGAGDKGPDSKQVVLKIKEEGLYSGTPIIPYLARRIRETAHPGLLALLSGAVLVPIPRSAIYQEGMPWPALAVAQALVAEGLAPRVERLLERHTAIRKAATAARGNRPTPREHVATLRASPLLAPRLVLVDDVVTSGAQIAGAAEALALVTPTAHLAAFAAVRTMSSGPVDELVAPVCGVIACSPSSARRDP